MRNELIEAGKNQAAGNYSLMLFCPNAKPIMEISYHILPADVRRNFRHSLSRSRNRGAVLFSLLAVVPVSGVSIIVWDQWSRGWLMLVPIFAIFGPFLLYVFIFSLAALEEHYPRGLHAPVSTTEITPDFLRFSERRMLDEELILKPIEVRWADVRGIHWHDGDIVFLCSGYIPNNFIPVSAFPDPHEAELFLEVARQYWEAAKNGTSIPAYDETIWPPAPRSGA